jgi:hypothetical protein
VGYSHPAQFSRLPRADRTAGTRAVLDDDRVPEFRIQDLRVLDLVVPSSLLAIVDDVIE